MPHKVLAIAGSPRRGGNSETLLDRALAGVAEAEPTADVRKIVLNEMNIKPCQNCRFCAGKGYCRFAESDDMKGVYEALEESDRFIVASPIFFANVSAQLKTMIDRCQPMWVRKFVKKQCHPNQDRRCLFLCCGGFEHDRFYECARQVIKTWAVVLDIRLTGELFYPGIDRRGDIDKHRAAFADAFEAGKKLMTGDG